MAERPGERVVTVLREQGRSQVWLASQLNVTPWLLNHWLAGRRNPPADLYVRIARILGVPGWVLVDEPAEKVGAA